MATRSTIRFLLNDQPLELADVRCDQTLLDYLRLERGLRGSKEGCAEGDCGACTVLVGRLRGDDLVYESVNACIRFVGSLDACHVVTIEHLSRPGGELHPVQQAMVEQHGSQCGFCTPGIVMSLYALWMRQAAPNVADIEQALQGNLCRCTGYEPIVRAAQSAARMADAGQDPLVAERQTVIASLRAMRDGNRVDCGTGSGRFIVPADVDDFAAVLEEHPDATIVAGATDVGLWVTKFMREIAPVVFISHLEKLREISVSEGAVTLGASVSYTEAFATIRIQFPAMAELWTRIGGEQVRNMGTIGGNIANGSPIGDTPPPLIALGAEVTLRKGTSRRVVRLEDFFIAYGKQDRAPGEFVESVRVPKPADGAIFAVHKISKRRDEDISALCGAFNIELASDGTVGAAVIAFGGMAATPKRASGAERALVGQPWNEAAVERAAAALAEDFSPISDMRASSDYRMLVAQNLLRRVFREASGEVAHLSRGAA
ncbi:MAG TPA: xanthine dehydrogenase small subunit [Devosiaceae bacterium]